MNKKETNFATFYLTYFNFPFQFFLSKNQDFLKTFLLMNGMNFI
jgi:hypothetical protein